MTINVWQVTAEQVDRFWHLKVAGLGGATQARRVSEIESMVKDFIAETTGEKASRIRLNLEIVLPKSVSKELADAATLREEAESARKEASLKVCRAAKLLKDDGLTVREIGLALGISFQRAQQLLKANSK